jgi:DNA-binding response OmpR family regulator
MDDYLTKPLELERLVATVRRWLDPSQAADVLRRCGDEIDRAAGLVPEGPCRREDRAGAADATGNSPKGA